MGQFSAPAENITNGPKIFVASVAHLYRIHLNSDVLVHSASAVSRENGTVEIFFIVVNHMVFKVTYFSLWIKNLGYSE